MAVHKLLVYAIKRVAPNLLTTYLANKEKVSLATLDKIVTVCCSLTNLCNSVVPSDGENIYCDFTLYMILYNIVRDLFTLFELLIFATVLKVS